MANALPNQSEQGFGVNENENGAASEDDDKPENHEQLDHKQNGLAVQETDRYGFVGGEQYTDPER